jgi:hypothetical protein
MGMDAVEIVILTEERFGIGIEDREAEKVRTPGMLVDLVAGKIATVSQQRCQSQRGFHLLRRALAKIAGAPRDAIRLQTRVRAFVERREEQAFWGALRSEIGARSWPALGVRSEMWMARQVAIFGIWMVGTLLLGAEFGLGAAIFGGAVVAVLGAALVERLEKPFRKYIPGKIVRVRDLVPFVVTSREIEWSREDISRVVREIVEEVLAPGDNYSEDADFVKELGMGWESAAEVNRKKRSWLEAYSGSFNYRFMPNDPSDRLIEKALPFKGDSLGIGLEAIAKIQLTRDVLDDVLECLRSAQSSEIGWGLFFVRGLLDSDPPQELLRFLVEKLPSWTRSESEDVRERAVPLLVRLRSNFVDYRAMMLQCLKDANPVVRGRALNEYQTFLSAEDIPILLELRNDNYMSETSMYSPLIYPLRNKALSIIEHLSGKVFAKDENVKALDDGHTVYWWDWAACLEWWEHRKGKSRNFWKR